VKLSGVSFSNNFPDWLRHADKRKIQNLRKVNADAKYQEITMKKLLWIFMYFVLFAVTQVHAAPYPLGSMSCDDIGTFASQAMQWREDGVQYKEAKTRLDALRPDESVEKKNMRVVMQLVFGNYGDNWTVESAGSTMKTDCESGR
jgi:hypothetical protein